MFTNWKRERQIREVMRTLSRQRVISVLQPGNGWLLEKGLVEDDENRGAIRTCHLRGWIEPIVESLPNIESPQDGKLPPDFASTGNQPVYRLTEAGWSAINKTHQWVLFTCLLASLTLLSTLLNLMLID